MADKVKYIRCVQPVQLGARTLGSLSEGTLTLGEYGVLVEHNGKRILVPYANIQHIGLG